MNLIDIFTAYPEYFYRKRIWITNENLTFDIRFKRVTSLLASVVTT